VTGDSGGEALARVGAGFLYGFGEATDTSAWDLGVVLGIEVTTRNGLARLVGVEGEGEIADDPVAGLRLSALLTRLDFETEGGSAYPPLMLYMGGKVGRAPFSYLGPGPDRRTEGETLALREDVGPVDAGAHDRGAGALRIPLDSVAALGLMVRACRRRRP
jgi:hypothetical protein